MGAVRVKRAPRAADGTILFYIAVKDSGRLRQTQPREVCTSTEGVWNHTQALPPKMKPVCVAL